MVQFSCVSGLLVDLLIDGVVQGGEAVEGEGDWSSGKGLMKEPVPDMVEVGTKYHKVAQAGCGVVASGWCGDERN